MRKWLNPETRVTHSKSSKLKNNSRTTCMAILIIVSKILYHELYEAFYDQRSMTWTASSWLEWVALYSFVKILEYLNQQNIKMERVKLFIAWIKVNLCHPFDFDLMPKFLNGMKSIIAWILQNVRSFFFYQLEMSFRLIPILGSDLDLIEKLIRIDSSQAVLLSVSAIHRIRFRISRHNLH